MDDVDKSQIFSHRRFGDGPVFVFCDHASNIIPDELNCLGLPADLLDTHIAYDIGAASVAQCLARAVSGELFTCGFSRLVIDPNRDPEAGDLVPISSDRIPIPGNQNLSLSSRAARIADYHEPYHQQLSRAVSDFAGCHRNPLYISVHSFTNRLMGASQERPWPIGLLWREDEASAHYMIDWLRSRTGEPVGDNEPYDARIFNYSVDRHIGPLKATHLTLELRQDRICDMNRASKISELVRQGIDALLESRK